MAFFDLCIKFGLITAITIFIISVVYFSNAYEIVIQASQIIFNEILKPFGTAYGLLYLDQIFLVFLFVSFWPQFLFDLASGNIKSYMDVVIFVGMNSVIVYLLFGLQWFPVFSQWPTPSLKVSLSSIKVLYH